MNLRTCCALHLPLIFAANVWRHDITVLRRHDITVLRRHDITVLRRHDITVLRRESGIRFDVWWRRGNNRQRPRAQIRVK